MNLRINYIYYGGRGVGRENIILSVCYPSQPEGQGPIAPLKAATDTHDNRLFPFSLILTPSLRGIDKKPTVAADVNWLIPSSPTVTVAVTPVGTGEEAKEGDYMGGTTGVGHRKCYSSRISFHPPGPSISPKVSSTADSPLHRDFFTGCLSVCLSVTNGRSTNSPLSPLTFQPDCFPYLTLSVCRTHEDIELRVAVANVAMKYRFTNRQARG